MPKHPISASSRALPVGLHEHSLGKGEVYIPPPAPPRPRLRRLARILAARTFLALAGLATAAAAWAMPNVEG